MQLLTQWIVYCPYKSHVDSKDSDQTHAVADNTPRNRLSLTQLIKRNLVTYYRVVLVTPIIQVTSLNRTLFAKSALFFLNFLHSVSILRLLSSGLYKPFLTVVKVVMISELFCLSWDITQDDANIN